MHLRRILPIAALLLMAINASGVLRAMHMLSAHAPQSIHAAHHPHEGHGDHAGQSGHSQTDPGEDQPTPAPDDEHGCELCFSLRSMHETVPQQPVLVVCEGLISPTIPQPVIVIRAHARPGAHPARGPPVC